MVAEDASILSVQDLVDRMGGTAEFARSIGVGASTASEMKRRGTVPVKYWAGLIEAAQASGIVIDAASLLKLHTPEGVVGS